jgi:hypothetical protein
MIDGSVAKRERFCASRGTTCVAQSLFILCVLIGIDDVAGLILRRPQNHLVRGIAELRLHCRASRSADGVSNEVEPRLKSNECAGQLALHSRIPTAARMLRRVR